MDSEYLQQKPKIEKAPGGRGYTSRYVYYY